MSRGSDGNVYAGAADVRSGRSQIRVFDLDALLAGGAPAAYTSGAVLGWGLRNSVGVAEDPATGNIWSVGNSIDNMRRRGRDIHNTNPGEELNFHGRPDDVASGVLGANFGYPGCVAIFDSAGVGDYPGGAETGEQMAGDQLAGNYSDAMCRAQTVAPRITFGAHLAPLDLVFDADGGAAYVAMHESW